ncbi:hypothetical protein FHS67_001236 [Aminobacter aminovorans]|uniref:Uncharacterized protein n=1 Tax=Aminobacter aminovorans TaxID=83263 RepID=A0ABR6H345_AMIAI|nr:hypothetical protein [Aminobacter aminovorans]
MSEALDEKASVGVQHDLDDGCVFECSAEVLAKGIPKLAYETRMRAKLRHVG